ncbi:hypothetical protein ATCC90586_004685 [Pythium insidiosum]|nr:hypothetical protein ATCC90586_004685 [Pythium insidiosum]
MAKVSSARIAATALALALILMCCALLGCSIVAASAVQAPHLMWSASPLSIASLTGPNDVWQDVRDTSVTFKLPNEAIVFISYDASVSRVNTNNFDDASSPLPSRQVSEVSFRVAVDGVPYRQSAASVGAVEPLITTISGYLAVELSAGEHVARLQWRKRGDAVRQWLISSSLLDGYAGGRNLMVSAQHRFMWFTQPLISAALESLDVWERVPGMELTLRLSEAATIRFFYQLPVRPPLVRFGST